MSVNGIRHLTSAPYHPATNGSAERAVQTLKAGLKKVPGNSLEERLDRFLFQYSITPQSTTGFAPSELLNRRLLRSRLDLIRPDLHAKMCKKFSKKGMCVQRRGSVWVWNCSPGRKWIVGTVINVEGDRSCSVELVTGFVVKRHVDQMRVKAYGDLEIQRDTALPHRVVEELSLAKWFQT